MATNEHKFTRNDLYELIWSKPMTHVANEFGISDVGLRKICIKHKIPVPGLGYWIKAQYGKQVYKKPLPELHAKERDNLNTIIIKQTKQNAVRHQVDQSPEIKEIKEFECLEDNKITVPNKLTRPHHLITFTKSRLAKQTTDQYGRFSLRNKECLHLNVCKESIPRALRILNSLISAFNSRGYEIVRDPDGRKYPAVKLLGETVEFSITEKVTRSDYIPTKQELAKYRETGWHYWPSYKYEPTGVLSLNITNFYTYNVRTKWTDKKSRPLEDQLNSFIVGLARAALQIRRKKEARERQRQEWEEQRRIEAELAKQAAEENARKEKLIHEAENYQKAQLIRQYIQAVTENQRDQNETPDFIAWKKWAESIANELDATIIDI